MRDTELPVRASSLRGFSALVTALGGSGKDLLAASGVDEKEIAQRDTFIGIGLLERLLDEIERDGFRFYVDRTSPLKAAFNAAQYALSLAAFAARAQGTPVTIGVASVKL